MAKTTLSITSLLSNAWKITTNNIPSVAMLIGVLVASALLQMIVGKLGLPSMFDQLLTTAISTVAMVMYTVGGLQLVRGKSQIDFSPAWADPKLILNVFLVNIMLGIAMAIGLLALILPAIYIALTYGMASILAVDEKLGPFEAFKRSAKITQGNKMFIFVFGLVALLLNFAGALALVVGLLVTVPLTAIAGFLLYDALRSGAKTSI